MLIIWLVLCMQSQNENVIIRIIIKTKKSNAFQNTKANQMGGCKCVNASQTLLLTEITRFDEKHTLFLIWLWLYISNMMSTSNILHTITSCDNPEDDISHTVKEYCNSPVKITKVTGLICDLPAYHLCHAHCEMLYEYQFYIILFYAQYVTIIL